MSEICRFRGIIIRMNFGDYARHSKPHVHVYYGEYEASVGIDGELLAGYMPKRQLVLIQAWMVIHENELYEAWNHAVRYESFAKIEPLQ